jgi:hypothetical protein
MTSATFYIKAIFRVVSLPLTIFLCAGYFFGITLIYSLLYLIACHVDWRNVVVD